MRREARDYTLTRERLLVAAARTRTLLSTKGSTTARSPRREEATAGPSILFLARISTPKPSFNGEMLLNT